MIIQKVNSRDDAIKCNELLTKLIINEGIYDNNLKKDYKVKEFFGIPVGISFKEFNKYINHV